MAYTYVYIRTYETCYEDGRRTQTLLYGRQAIRGTGQNSTTWQLLVWLAVSFGSLQLHLQAFVANLLTIHMLDGSLGIQRIVI